MGIPRPLPPRLLARQTGATKPHKFGRILHQTARWRQRAILQFRNRELVINTVLVPRTMVTGPAETEAVRGWLGRLNVRTLYMEPDSPWQKGPCESFIGRLRDELLPPGDLRHAVESGSACGAPAAPLQSAQARQLSGLPAPGAGGAGAMDVRPRFPRPSIHGWNREANMASGATNGGGSAPHRKIPFARAVVLGSMAMFPIRWSTIEKAVG